MARDNADQQGFAGSAESYRTLIAATGAAICEADADGVFTYVTDRYCELVGEAREELIGKRRFQELASDHSRKKIMRIIETAKETRKPLSLKGRYTRQDGSSTWVNLHATWIANDEGCDGHWIAVATDITSLKANEEATRQSEANKSFLLKLGDRLRLLSDPDEVLATAARSLGEHLGANRVAYSEISPDGVATLRQEYSNGVGRLVDSFPLAECAPELLNNLRNNLTEVVADAWQKRHLSVRQREVYEAASVRAHVSVPIHKRDRLVGSLGVHQARPRRWTSAEISLIEETAQRIRAAVDQAQAEAALRSSEAHLAAIFSQAAVGLSELSLDGRVRRVNDNLCTLLGRSREELLQLSAKEVTHPEDMAHTVEVLSGVVKNGGTVSLDKRYVRADGEIIFANSAVTRLDDEQGRPHAILVVTVDLTERRKAERALAEELEDSLRLQAISTQLVPHDDVQQLFEAIIRAAAEIVSADSSAMHLYDGDLAQLNLLTAFNVDERLRRACETEAVDARSACAEAMRTEKRVIVTDYTTDQRFAGSSSAQQYLEAGVRAAQSMPLITRSGRLVGMMATYWGATCTPEGRQLRLLDILGRQAADLIERDQADAALRASEARYRTLFDSIDEGFCVMEMIFGGDGKTVDFRYLTVNPAYEKQARAKNITGKTQRELVPNTEQYWFETFDEIVKTGAPKRFNRELRELRRWYDVYAFRFGSPEGHQVAALFSDITHRVKVEAELKHNDRRKNEFLAVLAHELRNPLAPIRAGIEVLRMTHPEDGNDARLLEVINRQIQQMVRLVDDLLDLSRISQGKMHIERKATKLQNILNDAIESTSSALNASRTTLSVGFPKEPVWIDADAVRLSQVFANLLNNAAKYTGAGGTIDLMANIEGRNLQVKVRDTGTGIRADMLQKIFESFTQAENAVSRGQGGLGIGLALVRTLVELHGGTVIARSDGEGAGSEFIVNLPNIVLEEPIDELATQAHNAAPLTSHKVLVVDDNIDAADTLATMLRMSGEDVQVAHSGVEGLSLAEEVHPQLILLDLGMPGLDGYEVARRIRSKPWGQSMVISALTGWGQGTDRERSKEAGFDYHLVKPVDLAALRAMINSLPSH